ncbi:succinylglutamate desuccinylase/aspartoacylase family protein [uncultured Aquitalea sp.]|uniref:succinylglutamate desuccinylase/aspartoacylase domain-containing protein n=1 Tax=uncultured Aquitalea sp. TaxID=540272 RepID=UPI0025DC36FB|nr:succinylglutamate desuccinylase/aspartoacylase family protein [uncultured Aquitalea sp.]
MSLPETFKSVHYAATQSGPRLIVLGAVHGNETCGSHGIRRLIAELDQGDVRLAKGSLTLVPVTNTRAYNLGQRGADRNLNRNLSPTDAPQDFEDHVANWLCPLLAAHEVLLDLHSFQSPGVAFAFMGPQNNDGPLEPFRHAAKEEALAARLGVSRLMDGWLSTYALGVERRVALFGDGGGRQAQLNTDARYGVGTTEFMRAQGGWALTLECGQHQDPQAPDVAYQAIRNTLAHLGMVDETAPPLVADIETLSLYEVVDKLHDDDSFVRAFASFDPIRKGEQIGLRHDGTPVLAIDDGCIVFPNPKAQTGQEWFYLARRSARLA